MRSPSLSKSKSYEQSSNTSRQSSSSEPRSERQCGDFKRSPERQPQQQRHPGRSLDPSRPPPTAAKMGIIDRFSKNSASLAVGQNTAAQTSSSSLSSEGNRTMPKAQETNATIDFEQAIQLLQELKKTASPEQLVALHRSLLPTKESPVVATPSPEDESSFTAPSVIRRKSMAPAGLATRGGETGDILRKKEQVEIPPRNPKRDLKSPAGRTHGRSWSFSNLSALHHIESAPEVEQPRPLTPLDFGNMGAFRPGTLRVTNGTASPDPSLRRPRSVEIDALADDANNRGQAPGMEKSHPASRIDGYVTDYFEQTMGDQKSNNETHDIPAIPQPQLKRFWRRRSAPVPRSTREASSSPARPVEITQEPAELHIPEPEDQSRTSMHNPRESNSADVVVHVSPVSSNESLAAPVSNPEPTQPVVSPIVSPAASPAPRQHRSQLAMRLSQDYAAECDLQSSPYVPRAISATFVANRLSTVYDNDTDDRDGTQTPEAALSKLNGDSDRKPVSHSASVTSTRSPNGTTPSPKPSSSDHTGVQNDSGYGSDSSSNILRGRLSANQPQAAASYQQVPVSQVNNDGPSPPNEPEEAQSIYTLQGALRTTSASLPVQANELTKPAAKKRSSLLRPLQVKRGSLSMLSVLAAKQSSETVDTVGSQATQTADSLGSERNARPTKKLQKRVPPSVEEKRTKLEQRYIEEKSAIELKRDETPAVPEELSSNLARRESSTQAQTSDSSAATPTGSTPDLPKDGAENKNTDPEQKRSRFRSFSRSRSKSRPRDSARNSTDVPMPTAAAETVKAKMSFDFMRKRKSGSVTPKRTSMDGGGGALNPPTPNEDGDSTYSVDLSSVGNVLGSSPFDLSNHLAERDEPTPRSGLRNETLQSPCQVSAGLPRCDLEAQKGMEADIASELAREKSRDISVRHSSDFGERPKTTTQRASLDGRSRGKSASRAIVDDRLPDLDGRPVARGQSTERPQGRRRPQSARPENIPPLPSMPADVLTKASKADEMVAKYQKEGRTSAPVSPASSPARPQPGGTLANLSEGNAESLRRSSVVRHATAASKPGDGEIKRVHVHRPRLSKQGSYKPQSVRAEIADSDHASPSTDASATPAGEHPPCLTPKHSSADMTNWDHQAAAWRQRRQSLGKTLGQPVPEATTPTPNTSTPPRPAPTSSPSIVISRYITPTQERTEEAAALAPSAILNESSYRQLTGAEAPNPTNPTTAPDDYTTKPYTPVPTVPHLARQRSPGGRVRTPSGNFHPFTPSDAPRAEYSRRKSLERLPSSARASSPSTADVPAMPTSPPPPPPPPQEQRGEDVRARSKRHTQPSPQRMGEGRFGGGFEYGFERGVGVGGSAGMRGSGEGRRLGGNEGGELGLDLSDVPVFLRRVG